MQKNDRSQAYTTGRRAFLGGSLAAGAAVLAGAVPATAVTGGSGDSGRFELLCQPYLLDPLGDRIQVIWHTETAGAVHRVVHGAAVRTMSEEQVLTAALGSRSRGPGWRATTASTMRLSRMREDHDSRITGRPAPPGIVDRPVFRHLATVTGLGPGRTPYRVVSIDEQGGRAVTPVHSLGRAPSPDKGVRLLLTSDHQLKTMAPANLELVAATLGVELDGILMAGDLVNTPDRASEWFDDASGLAYFAGMTGRARKEIAGRLYRGAPLVQHAPLYPVIGNHEVMGRYSATASLNTQFNEPQPRWAVRRRVPPGQLDDRSWNVRTYEELFPAPASASGGPRWWARRIGDVFVAGLFVTQIWRTPNPGVRGKYSEAPEDFAEPDRWGYGQFPFEPVHRDSRQYRWLDRELRSPAARSAKVRVVMFHHPAHGLGDNSAPPFCDPVQTVDRDPVTGAVTGVRYHYPLGEDQILRDLEPLVDRHRVHLVLNGHSHIWNRFRSARGTHWLETSNVGNTYGAYDTTSGRARNLPESPDYVKQGDPGGLRPVTPTIAPLRTADGSPLPFVSSNTVTVFSMLDSAAGVVRSYRYDTADPAGDTILFDEFPLI
ncbi:metallophosphoesterase family protein [Amycolatopsis sp. NPDC004378]